MSNLTQDILKELLHYNPDTGIFTFLKGRGGVWAGSIAGCMDNGYVRIRVLGKKYRAQRLAFLYMTGASVPDDMDVDHIDGDRSNNKFENLRICSGVENARNVKPHRDNSSGFKGVTYRNGKWRASLVVNCKRIHLGTFPEKEEAAKAYDAASAKYYGRFARPNFEMRISQ